MTMTVNKDLYAKIPANVVAFMKEETTVEYLSESVDGKGKPVKGEIVSDIRYKGQRLEATLYFTEGTEHITCRLDSVEDLDTLKFDYLLNSNKVDEAKALELAEAFKNDFDAIQKAVADAGYRLGLSHSVGDGLYGYWDVVMKESTFDAGKFLAIWKQFIELDNKLTNTFTELGIHV